MLYSGLKEIFLSYKIFNVSDIYDKDINEIEILNKIKDELGDLYIEGDEPWDKLEYLYIEMINEEYKNDINGNEKFIKENIIGIYYNKEIPDCISIILNMKNVQDNTLIINSFSLNFNNNNKGINYYDDISSDYISELGEKIDMVELQNLLNKEDNTLFNIKIAELKLYIFEGIITNY